MYFQPGDLIKYTTEDAWYFVSEVKEQESHDGFPLWVATTFNLKTGQIQWIEFESAENYFDTFYGDLYRDGVRIYGYH